MHCGSLVHANENATYGALHSRGTATTNALKPKRGNVTALYRVTRVNGPMVADKPVAIQTDQDRCPRRPSRSRQHIPVGRRGRRRSDSARHPCHHSPITSTTVMRMTAIQTQTERKRQDRSVRRIEKLCRRPGMPRTFGPIRPTTGAFATSCNAQAGKHLIDWRNQAILS